MAAGAACVETACGIRLRRLDNLAGAQAPRAHSHPLGAAVDRRAHRLEVRLEPPRGHVVRVADVVARHRTLAADFTPLRHGSLPEERERPWAPGPKSHPNTSPLL